MNRPKPPTNRFESKVQKSTRNLAYWTGAWVLSTAIFAFGPRLFWNQQLTINLLALGVNLLAGAWMIIAIKNYLKDLDEMHRQVLLEAMGITLGVTLTVGNSYSLVVAHDLVAFDDNIAPLLVLASFTFMASIFFGLRRYR
jgi:hypothetical protein